MDSLLLPDGRRLWFAGLELLQSDEGDPVINNPGAGDEGGTSVLAENVVGLDTEIDAAIATHSADTTAVHGIADTAALVLTDDRRLTFAYLTMMGA
jgi:hypothetical protein